MQKFLGFLAFASLAFAQSQTFTYTYGGLPMPVYPDDWNTVSVVSILVPRSITVTKVTASVQVQYSAVGDLNVYLYSAAGTRTKLLEKNCGGLQNIDTTFDDSAPSKFSDACPSQAGSGPYRGNEPLGNSTNQNAFGYWLLGVENNGSNSRSGFVTGFSITITGTALGPPVMGPSTIVSTSSFQSGIVAPGDQISLLGANLGPAGGVRADATQKLPTSLSQSSVTFDGVPAPLFFVSDRLVAAQAPATLTAGSTTRVQITSTSGTSASIPILVASTNPGIFTYQAGGQGQAKAINQDGSVNGDGTNTGSDVPAAAGSVIQVFATGLGQVNPAIGVGNPAPTSPLSTVTAPVTASIGGKAATVTFAGAAPGLIGVYQVNIRVPASVPSGAALLTLSVDGNNSQRGVTVQVR